MTASKLTMQVLNYTFISHVRKRFFLGGGGIVCEFSVTTFWGVSISYCPNSKFHSEILN